MSASEPREVLITPAQLLRNYRRDIFDFAAVASSDVAKSMGPLSCGKGCAYCCYSKVLIDLGEAALIYLHLKTSGQWTPALERKLQDADAAMTPVSHADWLPLHRPCVFLKEKGFGHGECQVYSVRPLGCAASFSVEEPAGCAEVHGRHLAWVSEEAARFFGTLHLAIMRGLGAETPLAMTIPGAVLYARALAERLPLPDVHRVSCYDLAHDESREALFDRTGAERVPP